MRKQYAEVTLRKLFALSGNKCAFPGCNQKVVDERNRIVGVICYINTARKQGQRNWPAKNDTESANFDNLILLCPAHYKVTDNAEKYTVEVLKEMKAAHEDRHIGDTYKVPEGVILEALTKIQATQAQPFVDKEQPVISQLQKLTQLPDAKAPADSKLIRRDIADIIQRLFDDNFPRLDRKALKIAQENKEKFEKTLYLEATENLTDDELNRFYDPDIQCITCEALKIAARKEVRDVRESLASLLVQRVKNDGDDLKRIIFNNAIQTMGKLTVGQMKVMAISWLLKHTFNTEIKTMAALNDFFNRDVKPFLDAKPTPPDFSCIAFSGSGTLEETIMYDLAKILRSHYAGLFSLPILPLAVEKLQLPDAFKHILGREDDGTYYIKFMNKRSLEEFLYRNSPGNKVVAELLELFNVHLMNLDDVKRKIVQETDLGKELLLAWQSSKLKNLNLSPVGITIAATYFEQVTGGDIHLTNWI